MADEKVTQLTELTVITGDDLVYLVDDPIDYTPEEFKHLMRREEEIDYS